MAMMLRRLIVAIRIAKDDPRPSIIAVRTTIGYGLPTRAGTEKAHGEPPGDEELNGAKRKLGWPEVPRFLVPDDVLAYFRQAQTGAKNWKLNWNSLLVSNYIRRHFQSRCSDLERRLQRSAFRKIGRYDLPEFPADPERNGYPRSLWQGVECRCQGAARAAGRLGGFGAIEQNLDRRTACIQIKTARKVEIFILA